MLFKLSNLNSNLALTLGYFNPALNNSVQMVKSSQVTKFMSELMQTNKDIASQSRVFTDRRMVGRRYE